MHAVGGMRGGDAASGQRRAAEWSLSAPAERLLFAALALVTVLPVWMFTYFPSTDGPVHLNIATIMNDAAEPRIARYFRFNDAIEPNVIAHYALALLDRVFGILAAEKVFLTLWALLFCVAVRRVVLAVNRDGAPIAYLFLPIVFNYYVQEGYYNFILGMALCFLVLGGWYGRRDRMAPWQYAVLGAVGVVIVWTHLFSLVMLTFLLGLITTFDYGMRLWDAWRDGDRGRIGPILGGYVRRAAALLLTFAPAMYFSVSFMLRHGLTAATAAEQDKLSLLKHLFGMSFLYSYSPVEAVFVVPYLALVAGLGVALLVQRWRDGRANAADAFLFGAAALVMIYMFVPITTKEVAITQRFLVYILAAGIFWLASIRLSRRAALGVVAAACVLVVATTLWRGWKYETYNRVLAGYVGAADHVAPGSTVLALHYWHAEDPLAGRQITWRTDPFRHASSYIAMRTEGVDLRSSMMAPSVYGYFPVIYRAEMDPYVTLGPDIESNPPAVELAAYTDTTGGEAVDYVLLWAAGDGAEGDAVHAQLEAAYDQVYRSSDGLTALWQRRPWQ